MTNQLQLKLLTPHEIVLECAADMILLPGMDGEFGVLYGHERMISSLQSGILKVHTDKDIQSIFISSGIAEISADYCYVMVDNAMHCNRLEMGKLRAQLVQLQTDLSQQEQNGFEKDYLNKQIKFFEYIEKSKHQN